MQTVFIQRVLEGKKSKEEREKKLRSATWTEFNKNVGSLDGVYVYRR